jgi:hypothetical protein
MRHMEFLRSMYATHAPYWIAGVVIALSVRRARRALEAIANTLRAQPPVP